MVKNEALLQYLIPFLGSVGRNRHSQIILRDCGEIRLLWMFRNCRNEEEERIFESRHQPIDCIWDINRDEGPFTCSNLQSQYLGIGLPTYFVQMRAKVAFSHCDGSQNDNHARTLQPHHQRVNYTRFNNR